MDRRILIAILVAVAMIATLGLGLMAGGGIVYAATRLSNLSSSGGLSPASQDLDPNAGVLVQAVDPGSAAAQAGLVRGDVILKIDGREVHNARELKEALSTLEPGRPVQLEIRHGDELRSLSFPLDERAGEAILAVLPCGPAGQDQSDLRGFLQGALVLDVVPNSPAEQAGLEPGSRILAVEGRELDPDFDLAAAIAEKAPGDRIQMTVVDPAGDTVDVDVTLGENPDAAGQPYLGVRYRTLPFLKGEPLPPGLLPDDQPFRQLPELPFDRGFTLPPGVDSLSGAIIQEVVPGSPAEDANLSPGDIITAFDDEPVDSPEDVVAMVGEHQPGDRVTLTILEHENQESVEVPVTLGENPEQEGAAYLGVRIGGFFQFHQQQAPDPQGRNFNFLQRLEALLQEFDFSVPEEALPLEGIPGGEA